MKRKQYTQIEDGTTKVSVISEQFLNITSRKRQLDKGDTDRIYKRRTLQAKKMEQLVEHVAEGDEESKAGVVDQQDPKFVEVVAKKSKALKENKKFTTRSLHLHRLSQHYAFCMHYNLPNANPLRLVNSTA